MIVHVLRSFFNQKQEGMGSTTPKAHHFSAAQLQRRSTFHRRRSIGAMSSGMRAVESAKKILKIRSTGLRVSSTVQPHYTGTTFDPRGECKLQVIWDDLEKMGWGTYEVGVDADDELTLLAAHSYLKVSGVSGEDPEEVNEINGVYVLSCDSWNDVPEYVQINGPGRIAMDGTDKWVIYHKLKGTPKYPYFYVEHNSLNVPEKDWSKSRKLGDVTCPTITKHELQEGQDVRLRKLHPDCHIPADKYPGKPCPFNEGDVCTVERIDGLFFAPKIAPDQWIPVRAGVPVEEVPLKEDEDPDDPLPRLQKKKGVAKSSKNTDLELEGSNQVMKGLKMLMEKVSSLEDEVKKLQS